MTIQIRIPNSEFPHFDTNHRRLKRPIAGQATSATLSRRELRRIIAEMID